MTNDDRASTTIDAMPSSLLLALRGLRRDVQPGQELWAGIAARVASEVPHDARPIGRDAGRGWPTASFATAAALALALGIGWRAAHLPDRAALPGTDGPVPLLVQEANALDREYDGALREALANRPDHPTDPAEPGMPDLGLLDRSATEIRAALLRDPDASFLLDQLQRVRARRLELTLDLPRLP